MPNADSMALADTREIPDDRAGPGHAGGGDETVVEGHSESPERRLVPAKPVLGLWGHVGGGLFAFNVDVDVGVVGLPASGHGYVDVADIGDAVDEGDGVVDGAALCWRTRPRRSPPRPRPRPHRRPDSGCAHALRSTRPAPPPPRHRRRGLRRECGRRRWPTTPIPTSVPPANTTSATSAPGGNRHQQRLVGAAPWRGLDLPNAARWMSVPEVGFGFSSLGWGPTTADFTP